MAARRISAGFAPVPGAALLARERALSDAKSAFSSSRRPETRDEPAIGKRCKLGNSEIHADHTLGSSRSYSLRFDRKSNLPALCVAPKAAGTDSAVAAEWSVNMYFQRSGHPFEAQPRSVEANPGELAKAETIPPALTTEAWESSLRSFLLHAAEESVVGLVQSLERRSLQGYRDERCRRIRLAPFRQGLTLIDVATCHSATIRANAFL